MTSKQRAYLRGLSNTMQPIFQVGKAGITENLIQQLSDALEAREIIKITVLENSDGDVREVGEELATETNSELVQTIGSKIVLYRKSIKNSKIELPR